MRRRVLPRRLCDLRLHRDRPSRSRHPRMLWPWQRRRSRGSKTQGQFAFAFGELTLWMAIAAWSMASFRVRADQRGLCQDMTPHRALERGLVGLAEVGQNGIERVELVEVT